MTEEQAKELMAGASVNDQTREALGLQPEDPAVYVKPDVFVRLFSEIRYVKARRWLSVYSQGYSLNQTERITGIDMRMHYYWKQKIPGYVEAFQRATEIRADHAEDELYRRGIMGYEEPLSYKGKLTGDKVRKYSDVLAIVALKALRPHKYRENTPATAVIAAPMKVTFNINLPAGTNSVSSETAPTLEIKPDNE